MNVNGHRTHSDSQNAKFGVDIIFDSSNDCPSIVVCVVNIIVLVWPSPLPIFQLIANVYLYQLTIHQYYMSYWLTNACLCIEKRGKMFTFTGNDTLEWPLWLCVFWLLNGMASCIKFEIDRHLKVCLTGDLLVCFCSALFKTRTYQNEKEK